MNKKMSNLDNNIKTNSLLEKTLTLIKSYSLWDFIKAFIVMFILAVFTFCLTQPSKVIEYFERAKTAEHTELLQQRAEQNIRIQKITDKLLYTTNAQRVEVIELHNGAIANGGLPFLKATCTFENVADNVIPISSQYKDISLSLIPFASYLNNHQIWYGNTEEMKQFDKSLCYRLLSNNTTHFAATRITDGTKTIGFLFVSFSNVSDVHNCNYVKEHINMAATEISILLSIKNR